MEAVKTTAAVFPIADLKICQEHILLQDLQDVQRAERKYVGKQTNGMNIYFAWTAVIAMLCGMALLALMLHWTGHEDIKTAVTVLCTVSLWPAYRYQLWTDTRQKAVTHFRERHPNYARVIRG